MSRISSRILIFTLLPMLIVGCKGNTQNATTDFGPEPWDQEEEVAPGTVAGHLDRAKKLVEMQPNSTLRITRKLALRSSESLTSKIVHFQQGHEISVQEILPTRPRCMLIVVLSTQIQERVAQSSYHDGISYDQESGGFSLESSAFPVEMSLLKARTLPDESGLIEISIDDSRGILRKLRCHFAKPPAEATTEDLLEIIGDALLIE